MPFVDVSQSGRVGRLVINRPEAMNAVSPKVLEELHAGLDALERAEAEVCIVAGAGDRAFSAGGDLVEMLAYSRETAADNLRLGTQLTRRLEAGPLVSIAAINGWALGGGTEIALGCNIRLASPTAKFGLPEVKVGIFPGWGGAVRLPRAVPLSLANDMILTGRVIDAEEAFRVGLVSDVSDDVVAAAQAVATRLLEAAPGARALARRVVDETLALPMDSALELSSERWMALMGTEERVEGHTAFVEKRKPNWIPQKVGT